jgi:hypothetical protein
VTTYPAIERGDRVAVASASARWGERATAALRRHGCDATLFLELPEADRKPLPSALEWLVAFKSDRIWSADELAMPLKGALNLHLAPPWYRGLGGYEMAVHRRWGRYGVTLHVMAQAIDAGSILKVELFPIPVGVTAADVAETAARRGLALFRGVFGQPLAPSGRNWEGPLHTRRDLERLVRCNPHLSRAGHRSDVAAQRIQECRTYAERI